MPNEPMSDERRAIVEAIKAAMTDWENSKQESKVYACQYILYHVIPNIPPAPPERWPRCHECGNYLDQRNVYSSPNDYHAVSCLSCGFSGVGNTADEALAAVRVAEQEEDMHNPKAKGGA